MKTIKQRVALALLMTCAPTVHLLFAATDTQADTANSGKAPQMQRSGKATVDTLPATSIGNVPKPTKPEPAAPVSLPPSYAWYNEGGENAPPPQQPAPATPPLAVVQPPPSTVPTPAAPQRAAPANRETDNGAALQHIDFRRDPNGSGRVILTLPQANTPVSDNKRGNTLTLTLPAVDVASNVQKNMDVQDFGTPVSSIDVAQRDNGTRITINAHEGFAYRTERTGNSYTVYVDKLKPVAEDKPTVAQKKKTFNGEKLSLNFQDIEVRAVLQLLADFTNKNIVVSDSVQGNITVRLKDVPWDQALDIVLESKNLAMRENGNVIWVAPAAELAAKEQQELQAIKAKEELEPLVTEYIPINFAKASDLVALIEKSKGDDKQSLLSSRGKISVDERTNTLLVQDTATQIRAMRDLVKVLDVPVEQVLIESRIVIANDDFNKELGARFGVTPTWANKDTAGIMTGHLGEGTTGYFNSLADASSAADPSKAKVKLPGLTDRLSVNLPVAGAAGSYGFTILSPDFIVDLELSALQAERKGEVISTPRVITSNQTKALIEQGVEIPYLQASSSGATNVAFKKAVLSLEVTPQITPDEHISMDLKVNQDTVGNVYSGVPSINTREIQTRVLVKNGQTVVLGGVHEEENLRGETKVPVLGDVPVLGSLFKTTNNANRKRELLVFVTPKIVDGKVK